MKRPIIAAILNFFFMGPGYIYNGRKIVLGIFFTLGALGLTYVETSIKDVVPNLYWIMFASVLVVNSCFAIDAYREAKDINAKL